ncbi:transmembrane 4 L6 family member 5-like [Callospermophilus lateralis]|uniref:transmembrane 4 L6 family member 5-like n=1 Tax=Callospermophilus lateralis TaxID=76772 RepID=UPI004038F311
MESVFRKEDKDLIPGNLHFYHTSSLTFTHAPTCFFLDPKTSNSLSLTDLCECAHCVGLSLIPLSLVCIVENVLLWVPDEKTWSSDQLSVHVLLMPGFIGGGLMVLCPGFRMVLAAWGGCCGSISLAHRVQIPCSCWCSVFGMLGAIYCLSVSGVGLRIGPKCSINGQWDYHFQETAGAYLKNDTSWNLCEEPLKVVPWNVTLFFLLVVASCLEIVLCGLHLVVEPIHDPGEIQKTEDILGNFQRR